MAKKAIHSAFQEQFRAALAKANELQAKADRLEGQAARVLREKSSLEQHMSFLLTAVANSMDVKSTNVRLSGDCSEIEYEDDINGVA